MATIDINSDLGEFAERLAEDAALMEFISSANIACGGHAGDEESMRAMVRAAVSRGVAVGAHPGYPDRVGFGRVRMQMEAERIEKSVEEQVRALDRIARAEGTRLVHVKPHGALYHAAMNDQNVAAAVAMGVGRIGRELILVGQYGARALSWWEQWGFAVAAEGFADRGYEADGTLTARGKPGALITDPARAAERAVGIAIEGKMEASGGGVIAVKADTICVHSDTPGSLEVAKAMRKGLEGAGVRVRALGRG